MFNKPTTFPICTIANTPRLPEHCIEWASVLEWPKVWGGEYRETELRGVHICRPLVLIVVFSCSREQTSSTTQTTLSISLGYTRPRSSVPQSLTLRVSRIRSPKVSLRTLFRQLRRPMQLLPVRALSFKKRNPSLLASSRFGRTFFYTILDETHAPTFVISCLLQRSLQDRNLVRPISQ